MDDWLTALLPGARLEPVTDLGGSARSHVRRVRADDRTVIVKEYVDGGGGWARERAALTVLPPEAPAPALIAAGSTPPALVMSDAGAGGNVADALLGPDRPGAVRAVMSWATAVAALHTATVGRRAAFATALREADSEASESWVDSDLAGAADMVAEHAAELGVDASPAALDELRGLATRLGGDGPAALTPGDTCPDNNVRAGTGLVLIDFEGAQWRHIAWDVAYLTVPWPSCWCAWQLPREVAERAVGAYRAAASASPFAAYTASPGFRRDVEAAAVGWAFVSASWFLPRVLSEDPPVGDSAKPAPSRRATVLHRLGQARESAELPAAAELAGRLHDVLTERWGAVPLAPAPAFTGRPAPVVG